MTKDKRDLEVGDYGRTRYTTEVDKWIKNSIL